MDQDDLIILDGSTKRHVLLQHGLEEIPSSNNRSESASDKWLEYLRIASRKDYDIVKKKPQITYIRN